EPFGSDAFRYFFQREVAFGQDGNFSWEAMVGRYNADLANGLGNLASRVTAMVERYRDGVLPGQGIPGDAEVAVQEAAVRAYADAKAALFDELAFERALAAIWRFVAAANGYLSDRKPWDLAKQGLTHELELDTVLYTGAEALRVAALLTAPWLTQAAPRLWEALGAPGKLAEQRLPAALAWGGMPRGARVSKVALFPRLDAEGRPAGSAS
ncbi:MAG TPA: class I tRNA ligase family protein, partial [Actinomycetota bacterium]